MQDEKWKDIVGRVLDDFDVLEHETKDLDPGPGDMEYIIFNGPLGKMKLERTNKPVILDKKGVGSRRIGSEVDIKYTYSDTEKVHIFKAYQWKDDQVGWVEMKMEKKGIFSI